jgi:splicing factor U2AF subunit
MYGAMHPTAVAPPVVSIQSVLERLRAAPSAGMQQGLVGQAAKDALQLFVGNVVSDGSTVDLKDFLNLAMRQVGLNSTAADPIILCRKSAKFSFIEFSNVEDCNAALNLNGIPFMGNLLKIDRPAKYAGPHVAARTWQEITGQSAPVGVIAGDTGLDSSTKPFRELFVGNTPPDTTGAALSDFLGGALQRMGLARPEGPSSPSSPISTVRVSTKFCFVEFRSVEEATNALNLNGIPFAGSTLNIKRSSKHDSALGPEPSTFFSWDDLLSRWMSGEVKLLTAGPVTKVLCITNMVSAADLANEDDFADMIEDTKEECSQYGRVASVFAPRTDARAAAEFGGGGRLFVEMQSTDDARAVLTALKGRSFDGRVVDVKFYPTDAWVNKKFAEPLETYIISSAGVVSTAEVFARREV